MTSPRVPGYSLIAFAATILIASIIASVKLNAFLVDIGAILLLIVGVMVLRGSRRGIRWGLAFMAIYVVIGVLLVLMGWMFDSLDARDIHAAAQNSPLAATVPNVDIAGILLAIKEHVNWLYITAGIITAWAVANMVLLVMHRRNQKQTA